MRKGLRYFIDSIKHLVKILSILVGVAAFWIGLILSCFTKPDLALPVYLIISLGCYGLLMVVLGLKCFPTCPQEAVLLQQGDLFE